MAVYAAYRHIELDNVGYGKKRVLKPPGGGTSDIFGAAPVEQSPRRRTNYLQSSLFVETEPVNTPARVKSGNPVTGEGHTTNGVKEASVSNGDDNSNESVNANINANTENAAAAADGSAAATTASAPTTSPVRAATAPQRSRVPPGGYSSGLW